MKNHTAMTLSSTAQPTDEVGLHDQIGAGAGPDLDRDIRIHFENVTVVTPALYRASKEIEARGINSVPLTSSVIVPIALRPVSVPGNVGLVDFDLRGGVGVGVQWRSNDCGTGESCARSFVDFATLMSRTPMSLTEVDRDQ